MTKQHNILGEVKRKKNNKILLNIGLCEKPQKPVSYKYEIILAVVIILIIIFGIGIPLLQRAVDIKVLKNCEAYGDCSEVIRDINAK